MEAGTPRKSVYRLSDLTPEQRNALLDSRVSAMLAFVDGDGFPRLAPCWFLWDGTAFYITSDPGKFHVRCLKANPRASVGIETGRHGPGVIANRQVKGVGEVELFRDLDHTWSRRIREKYLGPVEPGPVQSGSVAAGEPATPRMVIRLEPRRLTAHGGALTSSRPTVDPISMR